MAQYSISLLQESAQVFSVQLGANLIRISIQWMERYKVFRMDASLQNGTVITAGRIMNIGADLFSDVYPTPASNISGSLTLIGDEPTPANLGLNNTLVWSNG